MTTKFNKDMYAKMRAKKDEPLSNIGKKTVRITGRGFPAVPVTSITPVVSGAETTRTASPSTSIEELSTPTSKRPCLSSKDKEKVDSRTSTIWSNERLTMDRAHRVITADDLKVFFGVPSNTVASRHVHRLVQVRGFFFFFFFLHSSYLRSGFCFRRCWGKAFTLPLSI